MSTEDTHVEVDTNGERPDDDSTEDQPSSSSDRAPSPMDLARASKQKKFGHN